MVWRFDIAPRSAPMGGALVDDFNASPGTDVTRLLITLIFCGAAVALLSVLIPGNVVENIDGYEYARAAEIMPFGDTHDVRAALYHKFNRVLFAVVSALSGQTSAFETLVYVSLVSAVIALVLLVYVLEVGAGLPTAPAVLSAALLAASYGFLRYAVAAEVYLPAIALILATLVLVIRAEASALRHGGLALGTMIVPGVFAGLTTLTYLPNAIPVFLAMPVLLLARGRVLRAMTYAGAGGLVLFGGLTMLFLARGGAALTPASFLAFLAERNNQLLVPPVGLGSLVKSGNSLLHMIASTHWLWSFEGLVEGATRALPKRMYHLEEVTQTVRAMGPSAKLGALTFVMLGLAVGRLLVLRFRVRAEPRLLPQLARGVFGNRLLAYFVVWFGLHAAMTGWLDPAAEEAWIIALVPLVGFFAMAVVAPIVMRWGTASIAAFVVVLFVHNIVAGLWLFRASAAEPRVQRLVDIAGIARPGDAIVFMGREFFQRSHAHYRLGLLVLEVDGPDGRIFNIDPRATERARTAKLIDDVRRSGGRVFVLEAQLTQGNRIALREGPKAQVLLDAFVTAWQPRLKIVAEGPHGRTLEIVD